MIDPRQFPGKNPDEKVELFLRQHWIQPVAIFLSFIALITIPAILFVMIRVFLPDVLTSNALRGVAILLASAYALMAVLFLFQTYLDFYLDTWLITTERIIASERVSIFKHTTSELRLHNIQDVTTEVIGMLPTMLEYGTVYIQTAGESTRFSLDNVSNAKKIAEKIMQLTDAHRQAHGDIPPPAAPKPIPTISAS